MKKICLKGEILGISIRPMESFKSMKILRGCKEQGREVERKVLFDYLNSFGKDMLTFITSSPLFFSSEKGKNDELWCHAN